MKIFFSISVFLFLVLCLSCSKDDSIVNKPPCPPINIVPTPAYNSPVWHPNGKIIGFNYTPLKEIQYPYGEHCQGRQIWEYDSTGFWLIDTDGSDLRRTLPFQLQTPSWAPDGNWIAFVASDQIFKMRFDGNNFDTTSITQLTFQERNYFPDWSPDGNLIAFDSNNESPSGGYRIWQMDADGNNKSLIVNGRMPEWSNDLSHLLFIGLYTEVYKFSFISNDTTRVSNLNKQNSYSFYNNYPKYLPNNSKIIFLSQPKEKLPNIYILDSSGVHLKQLTEDGVDGDSGRPFDLGPDGNQIVYTRYDSKDWSYENGTIWVFDIISGNKTQLTFNEPPNE